MGPRPNPIDFTSEEAYDEAMDEFLAGPTTEAEADRQYAHNMGQERPEQAWILSDRDCWYANPYYDGPAVPHPEDDLYQEELMLAEEQEYFDEQAETEAYYLVHDDECPF